MKDVPRESSPLRFSSTDDRRRVFAERDAPRPRVEEQEGDWVDLYQLLDVPPNAPTFDLDEAIIARGADIVYFTFSRGGKPPQVKKLEEHLHDMRPILLDPATRRRYDEQLELHRQGDPRAQKYADFLRTLDLREQSGCMTALLFCFALPLAYWLCHAMSAL
jgi:hypothetical protein